MRQIAIILQLSKAKIFINELKIVSYYLNSSNKKSDIKYLIFLLRFYISNLIAYSDQIKNCLLTD